MGFACQGLWIMGYCRLMGCGLQIPTLVNPNEYGISEVMGYQVHGLREF